jgi:hypothetical protein
MLGDEGAERGPVLGERQQGEEVLAAQKEYGKARGDDGGEKSEAGIAGPGRCTLAIDGRLSKPLLWPSREYANPFRAKDAVNPM